MAFIKLNNIGKIYSTEGTLAIGIRNVNLEFDIGEFVTITGASGSGKTTLLNIISGLDTYEEGELLIEGEPTSHYIQKDWEKYREDYISFVFQDYKIIESFTVYENIELALMNIRDPKERRKRTLEIIERVGLTKFMKSKGSKLSGGQKQRTVIARALAKESPVILADEPTGNLDSETSKEIVELLKEISKDRLVIVVTHSFDLFEQYATRNIRIANGAIEADDELRKADEPSEVKKCESSNAKDDLKNSIILGIHKFFAKPKLAFFMTIIMIIGLVGLIFATAYFGFALKDQKTYVFTHIDGRVVISRTDGKAVTSGDANLLRIDLHAESCCLYDDLYDTIYYFNNGKHAMPDGYFKTSYDGKITKGRLPEKDNEVFLSIPAYAKDEYGELGQIKEFYNTPYVVVGYRYYYDNMKSAQIVLTSEGFDRLTKAYYFGRMSTSLVTANYQNVYPNIQVDNTLSGNEVIVESNVQTPDYYHVGDEVSLRVSSNNLYKEETLQIKSINLIDNNIYTYNVYISNEKADYLFAELAPTMHKQASLFFETDEDAQDALPELRERGYNAIVSNTTYVNSSAAVLNLVGRIGYIILWIVIVLFLALFIRLVFSRALAADKADVAIFRSMGIKRAVIKKSMYTQVSISSLISIVVAIAFCLAMYLSPASEYLPFLPWWSYLVILGGVAFIVLRTARAFNKKIFGQSVRKNMGRGK